MILKAPAKINLFLEILGKREDGYHEIQSIMVPVSLFDEIKLMESEDIKVECNDPSLPADDSNLAFKAAVLYLSYTGIERGVYIKIKKNIPIAAGLGGGSSDAAAVLKGLNRIYKRLSQKELFELAKKIGADVPFFLYESPCLAKGIGEILEPLPYIPFYLVLITPDIQVSTAWAYREYDKMVLTKSEQSSIKKLWMEGKLEALLKNDLEMVTERHYPVIGDIKRLLLGRGAKGVLMSGSGPTVFGIFDSEKETEEAIKDLPVKGKFFAVSSLNRNAWGVAKR